MADRFRRLFTAAADVGQAQRAHAAGASGWYVVNPSTGIVCSGPFGSEREAHADRVRREDFATALAVEFVV